MPLEKGNWLGEAIERVSMDDILNHFDVDTQIRSGRTWILCPDPAHDDHHFGSCVVNENGYHCFACNKTVGKYQMVKWLGHWNDKDTAKWFGHTSGVFKEEMVTNPDKEKIRGFLPYIRSLEKYVNNSQVIGSYNVSDDKMDCNFYFVDKNKNYLVSDVMTANPLLELYKEAPSLFFNMVTDILNKKIVSFKSMRRLGGNLNDGIEQQIDDVEKCLLETETLKKEIGL